MSNKEKKTSIGGQAVLEGVMMRGVRSECIAVRDEDGIIRKETSRRKPNAERSVFFRLFIIRGIINFFLSMIDGTRVLMRSAAVYGEDEPSKMEKVLAEKFKVNVMSVISFISVTLAIVFAVLLFVILPQFFTGLISKWLPIGKNSFWFNLIEGLIRIVIFVLYVVLVSLLKDIKRVFMYHGAEHKTISCYENGLDLTVENVKTCSRVHNRCGTTFLFYVMIVSILVFSLANSFFNFDKIYRILLKIALLPVVAGLSYELLKVLAKTDNKFWLILKAPGLLLQKLTTKEPTDDMIEVAIVSFKTVLEMDDNPDLPTEKFVTPEKLGTILERVKNDFYSQEIDLVDAEWIISIVANVPRSELKNNLDKNLKPSQIDKINNFVKDRLTGKPLQYIIGNTDFYGLELNCDSRALIPRPETEELVYHALSFITQNHKVLDLCCGTGAIGLKIKQEKNCEVTVSDISESALELTKENADKLGLNLNIVCSDMFNKIEGQFDCIVSNPPYIPTKDIEKLDKEVSFEPYNALDGGVDGLDFYKIISRDAINYLTIDGRIYLEFGINQAEDIKRIFSNYSSIEILKDINGIERIAIIRK